MPHRVINKCKYGKKIHSDSDVDLDDELLHSLEYISDSDQVCMEVQALYNTLSGTPSAGSLYGFKKNVELFSDSNTKTISSKQTLKYLLIMILIFLILVKINK